jgi:quercetin dioxygenase-like cupin family protein
VIYVKHDEQPWHVWRPGVTTRMWSGAATGAVALHMGEQYFEPGTGAPPHWHYYEEHVVFLEGKARVYYDGETSIVDAPGTAIFLPRKVHGFVNVGDGPLHICGATNWPVNETFFVDEDGDVVDTMRWWQSDAESGAAAAASPERAGGGAGD